MAQEQEVMDDLEKRELSTSDMASVREKEQAPVHVAAGTDETGIEDLPNELLVHVLRYLDILSRCRLTPLSKRWRGCAYTIRPYSQLKVDIETLLPTRWCREKGGRKKPLFISSNTEHFVVTSSNQERILLDDKFLSTFGKMVQDVKGSSLRKVTLSHIGIKFFDFTSVLGRVKREGFILSVNDAEITGIQGRLERRFQANQFGVPVGSFSAVVWDLTRTVPLDKNARCALLWELVDSDCEGFPVEHEDWKKLETFWARFLTAKPNFPWYPDMERAHNYYFDTWRKHMRAFLDEQEPTLILNNNDDLLSVPAFMLKSLKVSTTKELITLASGMLTRFGINLDLGEIMWPIAPPEKWTYDTEQAGHWMKWYNVPIIRMPMPTRTVRM